METTRGKIGYWFCLIIGIVIMCVQSYKYALNQLNLNFAEFGVTVTSVVLIFAPKAISKVFGKIVDKYLK